MNSSSREATLVSTISRLLLLAFAIIILLALLSEGFISRQIIQHKSFGYLLETTGNLQALSQRISFMALARQSVSNERLKRSLQKRFERNLQSFEQHSSELLAEIERNQLLSEDLKLKYLTSNESLRVKLTTFLESARGLNDGNNGTFTDIDFLLMLGDSSSSVYTSLDTLSGRLRREQAFAVDSYASKRQTLVLLNILLIAFTGTYVVFRLSKRVGTELGLRLEAERALQERLVDLEQFSSAVAHDLKGPLHNIHLAANLLRERLIQNPDPESLKLLTMVIEQVEQLSKMIQELLVFFRTDASRLQRSRVSLKEVVGQAVKRLELSLKQNDAKVNLQGDQIVFVDPVLFGNVIQNLIQNSLKHSSGSPLRIDIWSRRIRQPEKAIEIFVKDNGTGVPEELKQSLFLPFVRSEEAASGEGLGLGLAIVRRILDRHNGSITLEEANAGGGACFRILLPG